MEEYRIRSRSDIRREKERLLKELQSSSVSLKENAKLSFLPKVQTAHGSELDYNKLVSYALLAYRGIVWTKKVTSFFRKGKKKKRRR